MMSSLALFLFWLAPVAVLTWLLKHWFFTTLSRKKMIGLFVLIFLTGFVPAVDANVMTHWSSFAGHLSATSMVLPLFALFAPLAWKAPVNPLEKIGITALLWAFYLPALGLIAWDPYRYGYNANVGIIFFAVLSVTALWLAYWRVASVFALALLLFVFSVLPSGNWWDYLLDPFLVFYFSGATIRLGVKFLREKWQRST